MNVMRWLLDSDPSVRWQVMSDLTNERAEVVAAERARVAKEGWGKALLALQSPRGHWGGANDDGWMTTMRALAVLARLGVDPEDAGVRRAVARVKKNLRFRWHDNRPFFTGETEPCINGQILASGSYFGEAHASLVDQLLREQLADGGWNCEAPKSTRSSFHTTICVLEGLLMYERARGPNEQTARVTKARRRGEEYLLTRHLMRRESTGAIIDRRWLRFAFPPLWHYDVLRALDYMRDARVRRDDRITEAIQIVETRRHQNGLWPLNRVHKESVGLEMEKGVGRASYWNTLRALRVLTWYRDHVATPS